MQHITDTVGKPMDHIEMKIADLSDGHRCAIGETGEILIQGYNLMAGYYNADQPFATIFITTTLYTHYYSYYYLYLYFLYLAT